MKRFKINPHNQTQKSGGRTMKKKVLSVVMAAAMMTVTTMMTEAMIMLMREMIQIPMTVAVMTGTTKIF